MTIPIPYYDLLDFYCPEDFETWDEHKQLEFITKIYNLRDNQIMYDISCIISSVVNISGNQPFKDDEDCDILYDKEALKEYVDSLEYNDTEKENEDEEDEEIYSSCTEGIIHKDLVEIALSLNCSCKALDEAFIEYGFYDDGTYEPVIATIAPEEYINSRKRAYYVNTNDITPLLKSPMKDIKVDENWNII